MTGTRAIAVLLGALSLALPAPAASGATVALALCDGGTVNLPLDNQGPPASDGCCSKACHACQERKGRRGKNMRTGCC